MFRGVLVILLLSGLLTPVAANIYDPNPSFCAAYATKAVSQNNTAGAARCNLSGLRWSDDLEGQKQWCEGVSEAVAQAETQARAQALLNCFGGNVPLNKADLTLTPNALGESLIGAVRGTAGLKRVKQLLAAGTDLHFEGMQGNDGKILFVAMGREDLAMIKFFIGLGLDPNGTFNGGFSPIRMLTGNHVLLEYILQQGGDANNTGELFDFRELPLVAAIQYKDLTAVKILIKHGARVQVDEMMDECLNKTLLDYAIEHGTPAIVAELRKAGAQTYAECRPD
ncbi:ankyrin repeat domain-containing protein [Candidatus Thiothrix anitrata]|jgi:hypothetical protein|uniref:Ankyrin repeat domain-containing protein n=1 Tax=Candidatus Thiothrix anitrata TaxID=2823902 RepID=A0ABX7WZG4_9GAMM|nr:ankyrin repeat domain-containing protein [Candidatus Thiothrix anitrata]QTR49054.1 ankyrin repeat domain-containing protein [Candidatus Thiothrix anitrata]